MGYVAEGVTSYMGDRVLYECGVFEESQYFKEFETYLTRHFHNDGRKHMSVANSSWDTWLDGYVQGIPGRKTSIYTEGALIAYICDMRIRKATNNDASLHNVMQEMYKLAKTGKGYTETDYRNLLEKISGESFEDIFINLLHGTSDFTPFIIEALGYEGWKFEAKPSTKEYENFGLKGTWENGSFQIINILEGSTADKSGLIPSDAIHSINGIRINNDLSEWLIYFQEDSISLSIEREKRLKKIDLQPNNGKGFSKFKVSNKSK
jgi:predicted metalloprotease with PDZ domain